jgi:hypothetical protein
MLTDFETKLFEIIIDLPCKFKKYHRKILYIFYPISHNGNILQNQ